MADPYFSNVVLLLHFDGTNGATTFPDTSLSNHTVSHSGAGANFALTTAQQKFGTASLDSANTAASAASADSADWAFGSGQFTIEAFARPTATLSALRTIAAQFGGSGNLGWYFGFNSNTINFFYSTTGSDNPSVGAGYTPTLNNWIHVAVDRDTSNVLRVYVDGIVRASATVTATFFNSTRTLTIGNDENLTRGFIGQIDELRITKGIARYGGTFTPPTAPFDDFATAAVSQYAVGVA